MRMSHPVLDSENYDAWGVALTDLARPDPLGIAVAAIELVAWWDGKRSPMQAGPDGLTFTNGGYDAAEAIISAYLLGAGCVPIK